MQLRCYCRCSSLAGEHLWITTSSCCRSTSRDAIATALTHCCSRRPGLYLCCSGIKTNIGTINTWRYWGIVLLLVVLATVGKVTPACLVSKLLLRPKRSWRFCTAIGVMMNTRGLVELIGLNIGLSMVSWMARGVERGWANSP